MVDLPTEMTLKASSLGVELFDMLAGGGRFNFTLGPPGTIFTARVALAKEPGFVRIYDIRDARPQII